MFLAFRSFAAPFRDILNDTKERIDFNMSRRPVKGGEKVREIEYLNIDLIDQWGPCIYLAGI